MISIANVHKAKDSTRGVLDRVKLKLQHGYYDWQFF